MAHILERRIVTMLPDDSQQYLASMMSEGSEHKRKSKSKPKPLDEDERSNKSVVLHQNDRVVVFCSPYEDVSKTQRQRRTVRTFENNFGSEQPHIGKKRMTGDLEKGCEIENRLPPECTKTYGGDTDTTFDDSLNSIVISQSGIELGNNKCATTHPSGTNVKHKMRAFLKELLRFRTLKAFQIICAIYIAVMTFTSDLRDPATGFIAESESADESEHDGLILDHNVERAIVATSTSQVVCIVMARLSAWFMYPALVCVFLTKFRATQTCLSKSQLAIYMNTDSHELHVYCGWTILVCSLIHALLHIIRWGVQQNLSLLVTHYSGITGLLIMTSCLLICIPMTFFRRQIRYEIRKKMHYFFLLFAAALAFHTPRSAVPNGGFTFYVFGTLLCWYALDATYCCFFMTEKIETTRFSVLPSGVRMTMTVSEHFQKVGAKGGICYVCLPWVAKDEWHAFSLFENPTNPAERQIFIQKAGDWTTNLHKHTQRVTVRPAWVHGPFPSPYDNAMSYDNQILIASGIGITPALSVIGAHKNSRRINLIWAVRDRHLLEFFLRHLYLDHEGWNLIFYTGKEPLDMNSLNVHANTNVCVIDGRPNLHQVIPNIIFGIESRQGLPENYTLATQKVACEMIADRFMESSRRDDDASYVSVEEDLACYAAELGFHLDVGRISGKVKADTFMNRLSMGFRPWDKVDGAKDYVKKLDPTLVLPTWGILYCGGAKMVLKDLATISEEYDIGLHVESFEW